VESGYGQTDVTEPATEFSAKTHPAWPALGIRILNRTKSNCHDAPLRNLEAAKRLVQFRRGGALSPQLATGRLITTDNLPFGSALHAYGGS
jgi:hypothetical protein